MKIIALCGKAQVGKDTTADHLVKNHGYRKFAFADYLKQVAELGSWNGLKDERGRKYLQNLGDVMREYNPSIFTDEVRNKIGIYRQFCESNGLEAKVVISDTRLLAEIQSLKTDGAKVWLIKRSLTFESNLSSHSTEQMDEKVYNFDAILDNNGSFNQLYDGINYLIEDYAKKD